MTGWALLIGYYSRRRCSIVVDLGTIPYSRERAVTEGTSTWETKQVHWPEYGTERIKSE